MTTTGYGDLFAQTNTGRFFSILSFIVGQVLISLIVVSLSEITNFLPAEEKAYDTLRKDMTEHKCKSKAVDVIRTSLRLYRSTIKRDGKNFSLRFVFYSKLK